MNVLDYGKQRYDDRQIVKGEVAMENALMFDTLVPDELSVEVVSDYLGDRKLLTSLLEWYHTVDGEGYIVATGDIRKFTYGDPVFYYYNGVLQGKYYVRSVDRLSIDHFRVNAYSAVGLWANIQNLGGLYEGQTVGEIVAELLSGFTYTIDNDVADVPVFGWLPIATIRDNLQQVLFSVGASVMKNADGDPHIQFLDTESSIAVSDDRIFIGGQLSYRTPATTVAVTEHAFYKTEFDAEEVLFDNTDGSGAALNKTVVFDKPCYDLVAGGLTIVSSGANYAIVTGTGVLTGKPYTHTTRRVESSTGLSGEAREAKVENATLVSAVNSANVAARVASYEATAEEVACGIVMDNDDIKPGKIVTFNDPYGEATSGIVSKMNITMSGKSKADCTIVKGYKPTDFGNNYENVDILTADGTWSVPAGVDRIRIVLIGGGQAGWAGGSGRRGSDGTGARGGTGSQGGNGGLITVTDIDNPSSTWTLTLGSGGASAGAYGTPTTATDGTTTYSSADGAPSPIGYKEILTNQIFATRGGNGIDGEYGGDGGYRSNVRGDRGDDLYYDGKEWRGGAGGDGVYNDLGYGCGGGGGGAAYGRSGSSGGNGYMSGSRNFGGSGGRGATAVNFDVVAGYGCGGHGGNGGGGGGGGGYWLNQYTGGDQDGFASAGAGGSGSPGNPGGQGIAIIYY